jgi:hypothetical protein
MTLRKFKKGTGHHLLSNNHLRTYSSDKPPKYWRFQRAFGIIDPRELREWLHK